MIYNQSEFIKKYLNERVEEVSYAQIDLDISDLSVSDILRNINKTYPINSKCRNAIVSGRLAVAVMCRSDLMYPMKGLIIIVVNSDKPIEIVSKDYIVMTISDIDIQKEDTITDIIQSLTTFLVNNYKDVFDNFDEFFVKYVYDPKEDPEWDDEYYEE